MAYAAVISLKRTIERLKHPTNPPSTRSAYEELESLGNTLRRLNASSNRGIERSVINALDAEIREAVWKLQDVIETYVFHHHLPPSNDHTVDRKTVKKKIKSFLKTVKKLEEEYIIQLDNPLPEEEEDEEEEDDFVGNKSTTVRLSDQFEIIKNELLDRQSKIQMVSLVGMAGLGKTHLAREIYQHPEIVQDFDVTAWVRVGPKSKVEDILMDIVAQTEGRPRTLQDMATLTVSLKKRLAGLRFLIVLDDVWSVSVCNKLIMCLPVSRSKGRLLMTTRLERVVQFDRAGIHWVRFLNNEESWKLLQQTVFGDEYFPFQLETAGRKIAENCEGLPLLILAIADILCGVEKTEEYWNKVAESKTSAFTDAYDRIEKVLFSSYEYLPQHLKACFLYMGVFPQKSEIPRSKLITLWSFEDLFEPSGNLDLEDFAMDCLTELASSSLAIVCNHSSDSRIKSSKLHSAYWHLCAKEARKIKFFHVLNKLDDGAQDNIERQRRLCVQNNMLLGIKEVRDSMAAAAARVRSLLCTGKDHQYPVQLCFNLMLLKVLDAAAIRFYEFPTEVLRLSQLRYLALTHYGKLPPSISALQQMQLLVVRQHHNIKWLTRVEIWPYVSTKFKQLPLCLPMEIWDIRELRHLRVMGSNLPDPSNDAELPNLLTLHANADSCTEKVFRSIPNLRKLGIKIELQPEHEQEHEPAMSCIRHIGLLRELESLKCAVVNPHLRSHSEAVTPPHELWELPRSLKKLSLSGLGYSWNWITAIGALPQLKVLKLRCSAFRGPTWKTSSQFNSLEHLLLEDIDLVQWDKIVPLQYLKTDFQQNLWRSGVPEYWLFWMFRCLQRLTVRHCYKLKEIPPQIGYIPTLKTIQLVNCSPSLVASAKQIHQERKPSLQLVITSSWNL